MWGEWDEFVKTNIEGARNVLLAAKAAGLYGLAICVCACACVCVCVCYDTRISVRVVRARVCFFLCVSFFVSLLSLCIMLLLMLICFFA